MPVGAAVVRALLFVAAVQLPPPLPQQPGSGLILGRVVDAASGRPVAGAVVSLAGGGTSSPRAMTNANGQFVFRKLPKGRFNLTATKPGYVEGAYGRRRPGGTTRSVELDDGQRVGDIAIMVWRRAAIAGTVTDEAGEPVIGVNLNIYSRRYTAGHRRFVSSGVASTDDRGMYRFAALAPGDYIVAFVSRQVSMPPDVIELMRNPPAPTDTKAQEINRERMSLGAFISPPGFPQSMQVGPVIGAVDAAVPPPPTGDAANAQIFMYPTLFFPNSPSAARAGVITVQSGQERDGVDLSLRPVRAARVTGAVIGPDGPMANIGVHVAPSGDEEMTDIESAATMTDGDGNFTVPAVVAGQYVVKASRIPRPPATPPSNMVTTQIQVGGSMMGMSSTVSGTPPPPPPIPDVPGYFANTPLTVGNKNVDNVVVVLERGGRVAGRVEFEGSADRPDATALSRIPVILERADNSTALGLPGLTSPPGRVDENGTFKTYSQAPGKYIVRVAGSPSGWTLKSVTVEGRDISEKPFDLGTSDIGNVVITFTDRPTKLTGSVRTKDGNPDTDALVVLFPADPSDWSDFGLNPRRLRSVRPTNDGTYTFNALPAGDYYVTAVTEDATGSWQEPQALAELARSATQVRLADGDTRTQNIVRSGSDR
jgi:hypothetical protein